MPTEAAMSADPVARHTDRPWWAPRPRTIALIVFALLNYYGVHAVLRKIPTEFDRTTKREVKDFFRGEHGADSWYPMTVAYQFHLGHPGEAMYSQVFFADHVKMQYPPSALLIPHVLRRTQSDADPPETYAGEGYKAAGQELWTLYDRASWCCALLAVGFAGGIVLEALRDKPVRDIDRYAALLVALGMGLTFYPNVRAYTLGQIQPFIALCFAASVLGWIRGLRVVPGILMGLCGLIKPQFGLFLVWGLLRKEGKFTIAFAVTGLLGLFASLSVFGWNNHVDYLKVLSHIGRHGETYYPNNSMNGLLNRLLQNGNNVEWDGYTFSPYHPIVYFGTLISSIALIAVACWKPRGHGTWPGLADFLLMALVCTMASPVAWEHHYSVLLPMLAALGACLMYGDSRRRWEIAALGLAYMASSNLFHATNEFAGSIGNVGQSYLFAGALTVAFLLWRERDDRGARTTSR